MGYNMNHSVCNYMHFTVSFTDEEEEQCVPNIFLVNWSCIRIKSEASRENVPI